MLFAGIGIVDEDFRYRPGRFVGVKDGRIAYIGGEAPREDYGEVYPGEGKVLLPGFVNAHGHAAMTLMRGYAENMALSDWLNRKVFPFEELLDEDAIYAGTMLAAAEMLRFGTVSASDMYLSADAACRAALDSGIKLNFSLPIASFCEESLYVTPRYGELKRALEQYQGGGAGRIKIDLGIHAEYTTTERSVREAAQIAREEGIDVQLHLSETKAEHEACKARRGGKTPALYFYDCGVFDARTTAAHCVWLEEGDMDVIKEKGVAAACCPVSNLKLASGFCPAPKLLKRGIPVALGTDGAASNNNLNMLEEVKLFAVLYKASSGDPTAITPRQALYAATRAGALAQGREDCGLIKAGFRADLAVMDLRDRPYLRPCHDMLNNIVFSAQGTDVCLTMADGRVLYRDGEYASMDIGRVTRSAEAAVKRILDRI